MTELGRLLRETGIRAAVIVDDAYDLVPRPDELSDEDWSVFFDDLSREGTEQLARLYPRYGETTPEELKSSTEFVRVLWENQPKLPDEVAGALFGEYKRGNAADRRPLNRLVSYLKEWGLKCRTIGGGAVDEADKADLLVVDLFLGFRQVDGDVERAIDLVRAAVQGRPGRPPLVILMSSSSRLGTIKDEFRDKAGLLGSTFRVVKKEELADRHRIEMLLRRLAEHYEDATRVAGFVEAWDAGLDRARERFIRGLRRLDLWDIAQIRGLLLEFEGQELSEYLLDVCDRVLQYEIEADRETISAAVNLNRIEVDRYPAPHLTGSPDLQELVHRMVFLHSERLRLSAGRDSSGLHLQFGDVLLWYVEGGDVSERSVSLVVTPACDLVRGEVEHVMLLSGELLSLEPGNWSYKDSPVRTPIVVLPDGDRRWIKWNVKDVRTVSWPDLEKMASQSHGVERIGRLRETYAFEIQRKMLDHLGRIGNPANLPAAFAVQVELFFADTKSKARGIVGGGPRGAVCYVGRDEDAKPVHRLVLTEEECDEIERKVAGLDESEVHASARRSLSIIKGSRMLFNMLGRGEVEVPERTGGSKAVTDGGQVLAIVLRGVDFDEGSETDAKVRRAAVIVSVTDV